MLHRLPFVAGAKLTSHLGRPADGAGVRPPGVDTRSKTCFVIVFCPGGWFVGPLLLMLTPSARKTDQGLRNLRMN
jgi:hypothetical protein